MKTVVIEVGGLDASLAAFAKAWESGEGEPQARIRFATFEQLWKTITPNRWALLQVLAGAGVVSIRETARRAGRDVKAVHTDITALVNAGVLDKTAEGITFPYDSLHVDFMLKEAA